MYQCAECTTHLPQAKRIKDNENELIKELANDLLVKTPQNEKEIMVLSNVQIRAGSNEQSEASTSQQNISKDFTLAGLNEQSEASTSHQNISSDEIRVESESNEHSDYTLSAASKKNQKLGALIESSFGYDFQKFLNDEYTDYEFLSPQDDVLDDSTHEADLNIENEAEGVEGSEYYTGPQVVASEVSLPIAYESPKMLSQH